MQYSLPFQSFHSPSGVFLVQDNAGPRQASRDEILAAARQALLNVSSRGEALLSPGSVREFLRLRLNPSLQHEVFGVIYLTSQNHVIAYEEPFQGTLNQAAVYPRELVKAALDHNAASVILAHNHPSGCAEPSRADIDITKRIADALALVDVKVLDHVVIGDPDMTSLVERGLL